MNSKVEVTFCSKDKEKKCVLDEVLSWWITSEFMELDFEADKLSWIEGNYGWTVTKIKLN